MCHKKRYPLERLCYRPEKVDVVIIRTLHACHSFKTTESEKDKLGIF